MRYEGRPRTEVDIQDLSVVKKGGIKGITAVIGETERGKIGESTIVRTWAEFRKYFGGLADTWATPSTTLFPLLCQRALNAGATLRVARAEHYTDVTDNTTGTSVAGTLTLADIVFTASEVGNFDCSISIDPAADGTADEYDISVSLSRFPELDYIYKNMPEIVTAELAQTFSIGSRIVTMAAGTIALTVPTVGETDVLAGGDYDNANIVTADYTGAKVASTGIYVFDEDDDFTRIAVPHKAEPLIDIELSAYATERKATVRALVRTPDGITGYGGKDYRKGEGIYSHVPIDNHLVSMFFGTLKIKHPNTNADIQVTALADVIGLKAVRDNTKGEWFAAAGMSFNIPDALGVAYNLGSSARGLESNDLSDSGVNAIINHNEFGVVVYDNRSLQKKSTLLSHENVSELIVHMVRTISALVGTVLLEYPNDIDTWQMIHRRVTPFLDELVTRRAIWEDYLYEGDQYIDKIEDAIINDSDDIDAGAYKFKLSFKPKVALKYIHIVFSVSNSGVDLEAISQ